MHILIFGLPGTGKTTFAEHLAEKLKAIHLNTDKIRTELQLQGKYDEQSKGIVYETLFRTIEESIAEDKDIVVDGTFYKSIYRTRLQDLARKNGHEFVLIEIRAHEEVIEKRMKSNRKYSEADFKTYKVIRGIFEEEDEYEQRLILYSDRQSLEEMLEEARPYIDKGKDDR